MVCKNCGMENAEDFAFCAGCGAALTADDAAPEATTVPEYTYEADAFEDTTPATDPGKVFGIIALICGIVAVLVCLGCTCVCGCLGSLPGILCGVAAIVLGVIGMNKSKAAGYKNTLGVVGMILGIVGLAVFLLCTIVNMVIGGVSGLMNAASMDSYYYY